MGRGRVEKFVEPEQYIKWRNEGKSRAEICELLGIDEKKLHIELVCLRQTGQLPKGLIRKKDVPLRLFTKKQYLELSKTHSDIEIAKMWNCERCTISLMRKKWGLPRLNRKVTFTWEQYMAYGGEITDKEIERLEGLSRWTISRLKRNVWFPQLREKLDKGE